MQKLGLSPNLAFHDVYSLTDPSLLSFLPRPAHALLLVFPVTETYESHRRSEDAELPIYDGAGPGEKVMWFKQTIRNACGLIGLLHCVSNGYASSQIQAGSELDRLLQKAKLLKPDDRAELLYQNQELESAHAEAAKKGDSAAPDAEDVVNLHFVAIVRGSDGELWELDGRRKGPLLRGTLAEGDDVLSERALQLGVNSFLKREEEAGGGELRFSIVMLGEAFD